MPWIKPSRRGEKGWAYHNRPGIAALLKSDVLPDDPVITKGFQFLHRHIGKCGELISNYDTSVILMAFEAWREGVVRARCKRVGKDVRKRPGDFREPNYRLGSQDQKLLQQRRSHDQRHPL